MNYKSLIFFNFFSIAVFAQNIHAQDNEVYFCNNKIEIENCKCTGINMFIDKNNFQSEIGGDGCIKFSKYIQNNVQFNVKIETEGEYALFLHQKNDVDAGGIVKIICDKDIYICSQKLPINDDFSSIAVNTPIFFTKGVHLIQIYGKGSWFLDSVEVQPATDEVYKKYFEFQKLVTKEPSEQAEKLYDYLCRMQGKGILSGQQMDKFSAELNVIKKITGKTPAILGIDLIDFSTTRVEHGVSSKVIEEAVKWWNDGGIITCCWHWNAPMNLIDEGPDKYWYSGFYSKATTFNFAKALNNPESEEYKAILRDIDAIAIQLKKLQEKEIPVLWRPLHEAAGKWFWWGNQGSENYIKLYKLLFDRLQNYHQLNNLIWVWNAQEPTWYPGDDYVDIISYDSYPGAHKHTEVLEELEKIQSATSVRKIAALSENGALPDINKLSQTKVPWAWFCTWSGEFSVKGRTYSDAHTKTETLKEFYQNEYLISRENLPVLH